MLKIATQNSRVGVNTPDALRVLSECGFNAVDLGLPGGIPVAKIAKGELPLASYYDKPIEEILEDYVPVKAAGEQYGVEFFQCHAPFPIWRKGCDEINEYMMMVMEKCFIICDYLHIPHMVVHGITLPTKEEERAVNYPLYEKMIPWAKKYKVKVCLENLFTNFKGHIIEGICADANEACEYIDRLNEIAGEECFGFCLDIGHANLVGRKLRQYINTLGNRLSVLHIHDNNGKTDSHMMPYTQTHNWGQDFYTDWDSVIEGLRDIGYDGALSFETFRVMQVVPPELRPDALKMISAIGRYMKMRIETPKEEPEE